MSKRTVLYRDKMGKEWQDTAAAIMSHHRKAIGKRSGVVCSLPMSREKANRVASAIHAKRK